MAQQQQPQLRWQIQSYYRHSASTSLYTEHPASEVAIICDGILVVSSASTLYECHDLHQTNIKLLPAASNSAVCVVSAPLTGDGRRRVRRFKLTVAEPRFLTSLLEAAAAEGKRRPAAGQLLSSPTPESMCLLLNLKLCDPGFKATSTQTDNTLVSLLHNTAPLQPSQPSSADHFGATTGSNIFSHTTTQAADAMIKLMSEPAYLSCVQAVSRRLATARDQM